MNGTFTLRTFKTKYTLALLTFFLGYIYFLKFHVSRQIIL